MPIRCSRLAKLGTCLVPKVKPYRRAKLSSCSTAMLLFSHRTSDGDIFSTLTISLRTVDQHAVIMRSLSAPRQRSHARFVEPDCMPLKHLTAGPTMPSLRSWFHFDSTLMVCLRTDFRFPSYCTDPALQHTVQYSVLVDTRDEGPPLSRLSYHASINT